ncbi:hypothetical protein ABT330_31645 [Streptomyces sp. NPDC000658]|uniref:hypothetical protein n=1 Tax=Streptomyces sp. NPDC000658 TaxID=3154266 RepID=UPI0033265595
MNDAPNPKKPPVRRGTAPPAAAQGETSARSGSAEAGERTTAVPGTRLELPIQGLAVERRAGFYAPYLQSTGDYAVVDEEGKVTGQTGVFMDEPPPLGGFSTDVGDPAPSPDRDTRGWSCPPADPCVWDGIV